MVAPVVAIIDHDAAYARLMERTLQLEGFETRVLHGTSAYEEIVSDPPDIVMIDTWLSERDEGLAVLQMLAIGETTQRIPVLVATSDDAKDLDERIMALPGCHEVLKKPFTVEQITAVLHRLLDTPFAAK